MSRKVRFSYWLPDSKHDGLVCADFCEWTSDYSFPKMLHRSRKEFPITKGKSSNKHLCDFCFLPAARN